MTIAIRRGEVVIVTKPMPCCGATTALGHVFVVEGVMPRRTWCGNCRASSPGAAGVDSNRNGRQVYPVETLTSLGLRQTSTGRFVPDQKERSA
jgi:hypothetical protein